MHRLLQSRILAPLCLLPALAAAGPEARLADAAQQMDRSQVRLLLQQHADVNAPQPDGATALHWAAYHDDLEIASALIRAGADAKAANRYGVTPLWLACKNGSAAMVELLLQAGADPNTVFATGEPVLMTCARTGNLEAVRTLLKRGADVNARERTRGQTALMWAAAEGHVDVVEELIRAGADIRARLPSGFTALLLAVREGRMGVVRALLKAGADVNEKFEPPAPVAADAYTRTAGAGGFGGRAPRPGVTALILAVANAHFELAALLLDNGADPNAGPGYTALHVISDVRKPGAGDNDPAPQGSGNMDSLELVRKLARHGADLNARMTRRVNFGLTSLNTLGATPFLLAARTADSELMRLLAELGADPGIPNADGSTPLIVAAGLGTRSPGEDAGTEPEVLEAVRLALELGNDINAVDNNGETAMHAAAYKNLPAVVEYLYEKGARPEIWNRKNKRGWTPLTIARGYRFGNFKPSPVTVAAFRRVMSAAGIQDLEQEPAPHAGRNLEYAKPAPGARPPAGSLK